MSFDEKKLFEFEFLLNQMKPEITETELSAEQRKEGKVENIVSFDLVANEEGVHLKFANATGVAQPLMFLNPLAARALALLMLQTLTEEGHFEDEIVSAKFEEPTLH